MWPMPKRVKLENNALNQMNGCLVNIIALAEIYMLYLTSLAYVNSSNIYTSPYESPRIILCDRKSTAFFRKY